VTPKRTGLHVCVMLNYPKLPLPTTRKYRCRER